MRAVAEMNKSQDRRSGEARTADLTHRRAWWLNLQANPHATIEIKGIKRLVSARVARAEEKARYWPRLVAGYPVYNDYQARTAREIPVILLSEEGKP